MKSIVIKLIFLIIPVFFHLFYFWENSSKTSIGGGYYDLSGFIYGWLTIFYWCIFIIYLLVATLKQDNPSLKRYQQLLLVLAFICLIGGFFFFDLS